jgi:tripartite-type tricarboxylate transporter receptor subunit TctC
MKIASLALVLALLGLAADSTHAEYPERPIRIIVPSAPGGGPDVGTRLIGAELTNLLSQQIVVENRVGASGTIGTDAISRATPDGYTFGQGNFTSLNTSRILMAKLPYNPDRDLQAIVFAYMSRNILAVTPQLPVKSVPELIQHARQNPGQLIYTSSGNGTSMHFSGALFCLMTGVEMRHVPYKAAQQAIIDIIAGRGHLMFDNVQSIGPHVKSGRLRGLAVTSANRSSSYPDLPTVSEAGVPGFEVSPWAGYIAPSGVPKPIIKRLNAALNKAIETPAVRDKLIEMGLEPRGGAPEEFAVFVRREVAKWTDVAKRANVRIE